MIAIAESLKAAYRTDSLETDGGAGADEVSRILAIYSEEAVIDQIEILAKRWARHGAYARKMENGIAGSAVGRGACLEIRWRAVCQVRGLRPSPNRSSANWRMTVTMGLIGDLERTNIAILVTLTAKEGHQEQVATLLKRLSVATRATPGCVYHLVHRTAEPRTFVIYERYVDHAAWERDLESEHFARLVIDQAMTLLESSDRTELTPVEPDGPLSNTHD